MDNQQALPRGLRNNNPLNIRRSDEVFAGEITHFSSDPDFKQFKTPVMGYRAAFRILSTYLLVKGLKTVSDVINRWCPDTTAGRYIKAVCKITGFSSNTILNFYNCTQMITLVEAMSEVENGKKANIDDVCTAYLLATQPWLTLDDITR